MLFQMNVLHMSGNVVLVIVSWDVAVVLYKLRISFSSFALKIYPKPECTMSCISDNQEILVHNRSDCEL
jgi:hypothetical protein